MILSKDEEGYLMRQRSKAPTILALMAILMFAVTVNCRLVVNAAEGDVTINKTNFPDDTFRTYVSENCDENRDGVLSAGEISKIINIYVSNRGISSLEGIGYFTALKSLYCWNNRLSSLDVSKNTDMTELSCSDNQLTSLNVSGCNKLEQLWCADNNLTGLDVSSCTKLEGLICQKNKLSSLDLSRNTVLNTLACSDNSYKVNFVSEGFTIEGLDVNRISDLRGATIRGNLIVPNMGAAKISYTYDVKNSNVENPTFALLAIVEDLKDVAINAINFPDDTFRTYVSENCDENNDGILSSGEICETTEIEIRKKLTSLKGIEHFVLLQKLTCNNSKLKSLDVSKNMALTFLDCSDNKLSELDISKNINLQILHCFGNNLSSLDISRNTELTCLNCGHNDLRSLDVSKNPHLVQLEFRENRVSSLDIRNCPDLFYLDCAGNEISKLDVSQHTEFRVIFCQDNKIGELDVSNNPGLDFLNCGNNRLSSLDVSRNTALTVLACSGNDFSGLDVSKNAALTSLYCDENNLSNLDVSGNTSLTDLSCRGNKLSSLNVRLNTALIKLDCAENHLESLDVSSNNALTELKCYDNMLSNLDVSKNKSLEFLYCYTNKLDTLDVSENTVLEALDCEENNLNSLDVTKNKALSDLRCSDNGLTDLDVSKNTALRNLYCSGNYLCAIDVSKCVYLWNLICYDNVISVKFKRNGFQVEGLDVNRISNLKGAKIVGGLIVPDAGAIRITYTYNVKNKNVENPDFAILSIDHKHEFGTDWKSDGDGHWHECVCGEKKDFTGHSNVTTVTPATTSKDGKTETKCKVCKRVSEKKVIYAITSVAFSQSVFVYNGTIKNPDVRVVDREGNKVDPQYYSVKKAIGRKNIGKYAYKITFSGNYKGTKTISFVINPKGTRISRLVPLSKGFTVKWARQTKQTTGYQIQYSLKPDMKGAKLVTINKNTILTKTVKKLQANKKYYVQIRTYKTVAGKKYYSEWSKTGIVKTK